MQTTPNRLHLDATLILAKRTHQLTDSLLEIPAPFLQFPYHG